MNTSRIAFTWRGLLPFALILVASASACTSGSNGGSTITEDTKPTETVPDASAPDATDSTAPAPPKKDAAPPPPPPGECSSETTQTACVTCCSNKHEDGAAVYFVALIDCMCTVENCAKDCEATLCDPDNPQNADAACQGCVQAKNSKCATIIKTTCQNDADCTAFDACIGKSDCPGK
jgi:hypothetical protein